MWAHSLLAIKCLEIKARTTKSEAYGFLLPACPLDPANMIIHTHTQGFPFIYLYPPKDYSVVRGLYLESQRAFQSSTGYLNKPQVYTSSNSGTEHLFLERTDNCTGNPHPPYSRWCVPGPAFRCGWCTFTVLYTRAVRKSYDITLDQIRDLKINNQTKYKPLKGRY